MWPVRLLVVTTFVLLVTGCATKEQKKQAEEAKFKTYFAECQNSLGISDADIDKDPTNDKLNKVKWCFFTRILRQQVLEGSDDPYAKFIGIWIPNCEAIVGVDFFEATKEQKARLNSCIDMQVQQDIELRNRKEQMMILQRLINSGTREKVINCYSYGNWTQCK